MYTVTKKIPVLMAMVLMTAQLHAATGAEKGPDRASSVVSPVPAGPAASELLLHIKALEEVAAQMSRVVGPVTASIASHVKMVDPFNLVATTLKLSSASIGDVLADAAFWPTYLEVIDSKNPSCLGEFLSVPPADTPSKRNITKVVVESMDLGAHIEDLVKLMDTFPDAEFDVPGYNGLKPFFRCEGFAQFCKGTLEFRPHPDSDLVTLRFADLLRDKEGRDSPFLMVLDMSGWGYAGKYISINFGYKTEKIPANANNIEIWICPRSLVEQEQPPSLAHLMAQWDSPVGYFWTSGEDEVKADNFDYLIRHDDMDNGNIKWSKSSYFPNEMAKRNSGLGGWQNSNLLHQVCLIVH